MNNGEQARPNELLQYERERRGWSRGYLTQQIEAPEDRMVGRWEREGVLPHPDYRQKLCTLFGKSARELGFVRHGEVPFWNVPYRRNPFFTGREALLTQLHELLTTKKTAALTQPEAISGLGGIGKTQVALEYAYRYGAEYQAVLWVRAESRELLTSDFATLATLLNLPEKDEQNQSKAVEAVRRWLAALTRWLLILDNVEDLQVVSDFLPLEVKGQVLLTTRSQATGSIAHLVEVEVMEPEEGAFFLLRRAKLMAQDAPLDTVSYADWTTARAIVQATGGLPLALDQAGAYIEETTCSLSDYLLLFQTRQGPLLKRRGKFVNEYPWSVATTWSLAFEKVQQQSPAAADLLQLCAFLAPDAIPEEIITAGAARLGRVLQPVAADTYRLNEVIELLRTFSLVKRDPVQKLLNIHRLVQAVLKDQMSPEVYQQWAERTVQVVNQVFSDITPTTWFRYERYLPHALACAELIRHQEKKSPESGQLLTETGYYLWQRGLYAEAESLLKQAIAIHEQVFESDDPLLANSLNRLAGLYFTQGKYEQAELLVQRTLAIREKLFGPDHFQLAAPLNNLAVLYKAQGKYKQAESAYQRALAIREKMQGLDHPDVGESLTNLAELYYIQGKYVQAESLYRRSIAIFEHVFGPDHLSEAPALNFLAELYYTRGKYAQAESLVQRALAIREQALEADHRQIAESLYTLAKLYYAQSKYEQAELLFQRALSIWEKALGPDHPETAECLNTLAKLYYAQGKYAQAESLVHRALAIREKALGPDHPETAECLNTLAEIYYAQGKYAQAK